MIAPQTDQHIRSPSDGAEAHPALDYFVQAQQFLAAGDLVEAAKKTQQADESLRAVPIVDPSVHKALVEAHALVLAMAQEQQAGLQSDLKQTGRARRAVAQYGR